MFEQEKESQQRRRNILRTLLLNFSVAILQRNRFKNKVPRKTEE